MTNHHQPSPQGQAALVRLRSLVQEVWDSHRNSDDAHYNQCEQAECAWCQETREALNALDASPRQDVEALREVLDGIASPLAIDGDNHSAAVYHARAALSRVPAAPTEEK